jgi:hypothetical protein
VRPLAGIEPYSQGEVNAVMIADRRQACDFSSMPSTAKTIGASAVAAMFIQHTTPANVKMVHCRPANMCADAVLTALTAAAGGDHATFRRSPPAPQLSLSPACGGH